MPLDAVKRCVRYSGIHDLVRRCTAQSPIVRFWHENHTRRIYRRGISAPGIMLSRDTHQA